MLDPDELVAIGVFDGDRLIASRVLEITADRTAMTHFQAGREGYGGIHRYIVREAARVLHARGVAVSNEEQDLGLPGLRLFQQALRPIAMVRKLTVTDASP